MLLAESEVSKRGLAGGLAAHGRSPALVLSNLSRVSGYLRKVIFPSRWFCIAATPSINSAKILRFAIFVLPPAVAAALFLLLLLFGRIAVWAPSSLLPRDRMLRLFHTVISQISCSAEK
jgi:hypothetical protein